MPQTIRKMAHVMLAFAICSVFTFSCVGLNAETPVPQPPVSAENAASDAGEIREISLRHAATRESLTAIYRIGGVYQPEALEKINWLMRDYRCDKTIAIDVKLIDLIWELHRDLGASGPVRIISGYRSEGYNASLLRAGRVVDPQSQHMYGRAADVHFPGVPAARLREAAIQRKLGGVGLYLFSGPAFVHLDTGPVRNWQEMHPAMRRQLLRPAARRTRLSIDCGLAMADALRQVSPETALAALPEGAAASLSPKLAAPAPDAIIPAPRPMTAFCHGAAALHVTVAPVESAARRVALTMAESFCAMPGACGRGPRRKLSDAVSASAFSSPPLARVSGACPPRIAQKAVRTAPVARARKRPRFLLRRGKPEAAKPRRVTRSGRRKRR